MMNKETSIDSRQVADLRTQLLFVLMIAMMLALFLSRAALSISMIIFVALSFFHSNTRMHIRNYFSSVLLIGLSMLFLIPLISGIWSEDSKSWMDNIQIKLPLIFFPLAFAGPIHFSKRKWNVLSLLFIFLACLGTIWSMFHYVSDLDKINESYLRAKSMLTPLGNDHVRFSWLVSIAILTACWLLVRTNGGYKFFRWVIILCIVWFVIFLHILAARTGLLSLYLMVFVSVIWLLYKRIRKVYAIAGLIIFLSLPVLAYCFLPTFHNRVSYVLYDLRNFRTVEYVPGSNDAVRLISMKAGWELMNESPATGKGFGDIGHASKEWYGKNYTEMLEADKILPSSEWLMYGAGAGWTGFLLFSIIMLLPFFIKTKDALPWWLLNISACSGFLFDIGLEVQYGVFIYSFILLWFWKWLNE